MSETNQPIDSKSLQILDAALQRGITLTPSVPAEELLSKMRFGPREHQRLTDTFRNPPPATEWLTDPWLARYLPFVLRWQDSSVEDPGRTRALQRLLEGEADSRRWRWTPWIYPSHIFMAAIVLAILLATTIVPMFKQIFLDFDLRLPAPTRWLIWISDAITLHPISSIGTVIAALSFLGLARIVPLWIADRIPAGSMLSTLRSGSQRHVLGMARWTGSLAEMLQLGIPIPQAIAMAGILSGQRSLEMQSMRLAQESAIAGEVDKSSSSTVYRTLPFSPVAMNALHYPDSQKRVALLRGLSDLYWDRMMISSRGSAAWIAPLAVVLTGAFVAFVVIALFLPLISLITSLSG